MLQRHLWIDSARFLSPPWNRVSISWFQCVSYLCCLSKCCCKGCKEGNHDVPLERSMPLRLDMRLWSDFRFDTRGFLGFGAGTVVVVVVGGTGGVTTVRKVPGTRSLMLPEKASIMGPICCPKGVARNSLAWFKILEGKFFSREKLKCRIGKMIAVVSK